MPYGDVILSKPHHQHWVVLFYGFCDGLGDFVVDGVFYVLLELFEFLGVVDVYCFVDHFGGYVCELVVFCFDSCYPVFV